MIHQAKILDGTRIADKYLEMAREKIQGINRASSGTLTLATLQIGESNDATLYARYLKGLLGKIGIRLTSVVLDGNSSEEAAIREILKLNTDPQVTGIMIFSPLPHRISAVNLLDNLDMRKDVEGRTFLKSHFGVFSPTANAVLALLEETHCDFVGKEAVIVGHSDLVGKPTAVLLMDRMATVTVCHKATRDLKAHLQNADIVVAAVGKPGVVNGEWIKPGAIVIDVGENVVDGKLVGDVVFETAKDRAAFISPVPGGVGPVTNVMLIKNLLMLHELNTQRNGRNGSR